MVCATFQNQPSESQSIRDLFQSANVPSGESSQRSLKTGLFFSFEESVVRRIVHIIFTSSQYDALKPLVLKFAEEMDGKPGFENRARWLREVRGVQSCDNDGAPGRMPVYSSDEDSDEDFDPPDGPFPFESAIANPLKPSAPKPEECFRPIRGASGPYLYKPSGVMGAQPSAPKLSFTRQLYPRLDSCHDKMANFSKAQLGAELVSAINSDRISLVKQCLEHGANVNVQDSKGWTPIFFATKFDYKDILSMLIQSGAKVDHLSKSGANAAHIAAEYGSPHCLKRLIDAGIDFKKRESRPQDLDPFYPSPQGKTPLEKAARNSRIDVLKVLVSYKYQSFDSAFLEAVHFEQFEAMKVLFPFAKNREDAFKWALAHQYKTACYLKGLERYYKVHF